MPIEIVRDHHNGVFDRCYWGKPVINRFACLCLLPSMILFSAACQQSSDYDRRPVSSSTRGSSSFGDGSSNALDPNDPCGARRAFGFGFGFASFSTDDSATNGAFIVGGRAATSNDLVTRSTVKIHLGSGHCSGTLIGPNHVITAAHCFQNTAQASQIRLGFGENGSPNPNLDITGIVLHPRYRGIFGNADGSYANQVFYDVAVIAFEGDIGLGISTYPVVIGSTANEVRSGTSVIIAGYGAHSERDNRLRPLTLAETEVDEVSTSLREIQLVAGQGKGACYGDSGGPTFTFDSRRSCLKVIGTTTGPGRASDLTCDYGSGTMMDITTYKGWIKCAFEDLNKPLSYLSSDASRTDCSQNQPIF